MYSVKSTSFVHDRFALFIDCVGSPRQKLPTSFQRGPNPALPRLLSQSQTDRPQTAASEVSDLITPSCRKRPLKSRRPGPGGICAVSFFKFSSTHQAPNFRLHPTHPHLPHPRPPRACLGIPFDLWRDSSCNVQLPGAHKSTDKGAFCLKHTHTRTHKHTLSGPSYTGSV